VGPTAVAIGSLLGACAAPPSDPVQLRTAATLTPPSPSTRDLLRLPPPRGKIVAAAYGFRDQTGQYKPSPDSLFSTSVTQGAASAADQGAEGFGLVHAGGTGKPAGALTERRVVRAMENPSGQNGADSIPPLLPASILVDGGIIAYESNLRTGSISARFLGVGAATQYRVDQVTVNLRSIDIRTGAILHSVSTTKSISPTRSRPMSMFVNYTDLLEFEAEPAQLSVKEAIEAAVIHVLIQGIKEGNWRLRNPEDWNSPVIQKYLAAAEGYVQGGAGLPAAPAPGAAGATPADAGNRQTAS